MRRRKNRVRIGILTHNYPINSKDRKDAGIFIYDFAQELAKYADVFIFSPDFGGSKENYRKVPVTWFKWDNKNEKLGSWKLYNPIYIYKFFKLIYIGQKKAIDFAKKSSIDYCLCCWAIPSAIYGLRIKQSLKISYASWSLGSDVNKYVKIPILSQFIYLSLRSADKLYANSYHLCGQVKKITGRNCSFLPAITDFKLKKIKSIKKQKKFTFLFVGRLEKVKGPDVLIDAIKILLKNERNFVVNILGDGSMKDELISKSKEIKEFANFIGWADEAAVGGYMKTSDCLIIPSRNESLPLVIIEAAKMRLPIIAAKVGDCDRMIKKYKIGFSFNKEDPIALSIKMEKMMNARFNKNKSKFSDLTNDFSQIKTARSFLKGVNI